MSVERRTALLIAYHFPPCGSSSGLQRTLSNAMYLRDFGWEPIVLSVSPPAYERTTDTQLSDVPDGVTVVRVPSFDAGRHLAVAGRYWSLLTYPDRWLSWWLSAVPVAINLVRKRRVGVIWSTYPIATAHLIGAAVARATSTPWVADFRDPMVEHFPETDEWFPTDPRMRRVRLWVERTAVSRADALVFCTERARRIVLDRYPQFPAAAAQVITNGFEERAFHDAEAMLAERPASRRRVLLHSGKIYWGSDRDPSTLMAAIRDLADVGTITPDTFELRLRDPSDEAEIARVAAQTGTSEFVTIAPPLPYREALAEMLASDGLLLLQGFTSNPAVPAKLYEYIRARRPILGLVHPDGESARTLHEIGYDSTVDLFDRDGIRGLLGAWVAGEGVARVSVPDDQVASYDRRGLARDLAGLFDRVADITPMCD